jgi:hypothetical protein
VLLDKRCRYPAAGRNRSDSGLFIITHEAAVSGHIRTEDGGQFAYIAVLGHGIVLFKRFENENVEQLRYVVIIQNNQSRTEGQGL